MGDFVSIYVTWDEALAAEERKDYATAARMYRICNIYYKNGELSIYSEEAEEKGWTAYRKFWKMLKKLPKEEQAKIKREYAIHSQKTPTGQLFLSDWREFIRDQYKIMNPDLRDFL